MKKLATTDTLAWKVWHQQQQRKKRKAKEPEPPQAQQFPYTLPADI